MSSTDIANNNAPVSAETYKIPLVVIVGSTAVGKTEIALQVAEQLGGEIVSADSRTFYRGMDIGTAKPSVDERQQVPHHLIDVADPDESWSLAVFQQEANRAIYKIFANQHLPILVGGTGQFVRSVTEGWIIPRVEPNLKLRKALTDWARDIGAAAMHSRLAILDPDAAKSIDYTNVRRTLRALEVIFTTGKLFSDQKLHGETRYDTLIIGLYRPRVELYRRIDDRIDEMIEQGLVGEVQRLLDYGYSRDLPTMSAIGYREIALYLRGEITLDEARTIMKRRTREFVRRQANWFKENDPDIHWYLVGPSSAPEIEKYILKWLENK